MANERMLLDAVEKLAVRHPEGRRWVLRVARVLPALSVLLVIAAVGGSCGKGVFPFANSTSTSTATTTPTTGALVYVTNFNDAKISEFNRNSNTGELATPRTVKAGAVKGPIQLTVALSQQVLYVANQADNSVHEFGIASSGKLSPIGAGAIAAGTSPQQVAVTPNGSFAYAVNLGGAAGSISEYTVNSANGALASNGTTASGVTHPISLVATDTFLYVADLKSGNGVVLSYPIHADGTLATPPGSVPSLGVVTASTPGPMIIDASNGPFVFVSDTTQGIVSVFKTSGGALSFVSRTLPTTSAQAGLVYVTTPNSNTFLYSANQLVNSVSVSSFNTILGTLTPLGVSPLVSGLDQPTGLATDPLGQFLYVTNQGNGTVTQFTIDATTGALSSPVSFDTENPANANSAPRFIGITR
jgi:6-phosphogluconolactonase (cycloisomerase 2 family)